jgi:glycosyltransferase involved in cell wall biosynthesis
MASAELIMLSTFDRSGGGRETWAYNFIPQLLAADPSLTLTIYGVRTRDGRDFTEALLEAVGPANRARVNIVFFEVKRGVPFFFSMLKQLTSHSLTSDQPPPDYTLAIGSIAELLLMLPSPRLRKTRKVVWLRTIYFSEKAYVLHPMLLKLARRAEPLLLGQADVLLTNGDDISAYYERFGLKSHVIKNGVVSSRWSMPEPTLGDVIKVGYVGRLTKVKGIEQFLSLAQRVKAGPSAARFEFHVIGDTSHHAEALESKARGDIICHGPVDNREMPEAIARLDVCVALTFSSTTDGGGGTSNALMEQMAAGRVIVAWDNAIFTQLLDERSAYMVSQGSVDGLVAALESIAADPAEARARAKAAVTTIGGYSIDAQVTKFRQVLGAMPS